MEALKQLWEAVEKAQKAWAIIALVVAEALQAIGIGSSSMRHVVAAAIIAGAVLGFFFTVSRFRGRGAVTCGRAARRYIWIFWLPCIVVILMFLLLEPDTMKTLGLEKLFGFLIRSAFLPNLIAFFCAFAAMYLLIGTIVLRSSRLHEKAANKPGT
jgi:hypothetical protein